MGPTHSRNKLLPLYCVEIMRMNGPVFRQPQMPQWHGQDRIYFFFCLFCNGPEILVAKTVYHLMAG